MNMNKFTKTVATPAPIIPSSGNPSNPNTSSELIKRFNKTAIIEI